MNIKYLSDSNRGLIVVIVLAVIILFPLAYSLASFVFVSESGDETPFLERPAEQYENCVKETSYMRFHHWELLRKVREEVVRYGKRGEIGLNRCRDCHTSRERFCNKCHDAVSLYPDCFGCHYYP